MSIDHDDEFEPRHNASPTDRVLQELQLYGYRPFQDEPDPRPLPEAQAPRRQHLRHLRRPRGGARRYAPRTRPRGSALVDGERVPPRHRPDRARTRRQRAGAAEIAAGTGRQRGEIRRAGTADLGRADADRAPQRLRADARPGRRPVRAPHAFSLAAAQRIEGQPSPSHRRDDRQPRLSRRQEARRPGGAVCPPGRRWP